MTVGVRVAMSAAALVLMTACGGSSSDPKHSADLAYDPSTKAKAEKFVAAAKSTFVDDNFGFFSLQANVGRPLQVNGSYDMAKSAVDYLLKSDFGDAEAYEIQTVLVSSQGFVRLRTAENDKVSCWLKLDPRGGVAPDSGPVAPMPSVEAPWTRLPMNARILGFAKDDPSYIHVRLRLADVLPSMFPTDASRGPFSVPADAMVSGILHLTRGRIEGITIRMGDVVRAADRHDIDIVSDYFDADLEARKDLAGRDVSISYRNVGQDRGVQKPDLSKDVPTGPSANCFDASGLVESRRIPV